MIELRRRIELAVRHPIFGPLVIVMLALLLGLVFLHIAQDDSGVVADLGAICFAVATVVGAMLVSRSLREPELLVVSIARGRAPPPIQLAFQPAVIGRIAELLIPLRR